MERDEYPLFFDLSKLPEPKAVGANGCREMQLWQPKRSPQLRKQSCFFPPPPPSRSKTPVELPGTACTLHATDAGPKSVAAIDTQPPLDLPTKTPLLSTPCNEGADYTAANLWHILNSPANTNYKYDEDLNTFTYHPISDIFAAPYGTYDHRLEAVGMPVELEDTGIDLPLPFVHANCLTGVANARGANELSEEDEGGAEV